MEEINKEEAPTSIKLEVELMQDGQLSVKCPMIGDTLFCLGLLEMAKAVVFQFKASQAKIVKPQNGIMNFARRFSK